MKARIRKLLREVLAEMGLNQSGQTGPGSIGTGRVPSGKSAPRVLTLFHTGVERVEEAYAQVAKIEEAARKSSFFMGPEARSLLCETEVKEATGARCSVNTVPAEGLARLLDHVEVVVLPTLSLKVAARVAGLSLDCPGSELVMTALLKGCRVVAANDGFLKPGVEPEPGLKAKVAETLAVLASFGVILCPTARLAETYLSLGQEGGERGSTVKPSPSAPAPEGGGAQNPGGAGPRPLAYIAAKDVSQAVNEGRREITAAPKAIVSPLARDMAREYGIKIITRNEPGF